jgi:serine/threonine protein phosphatase PrpC
LIDESTGQYEVSSPLHSCRLRMSRSIGDFYLKWRTVEEELSEEQRAGCLETKGSYSSPLIRVSGTPADAPRYVALQPPRQQAVTCEPVVTHQPRVLERYLSLPSRLFLISCGYRDLFLLIACDGVWDVMSSEEAIHFISAQLCQSHATMTTGRPPSSAAPLLTDDDLQRIAASACDQLLAECLQRRSNDNMTVVLILFPRMSQLLRTQQHQQQRTACRSSNLGEISTHSVTTVLSDSPSGLSSSVTTPFFQRNLRINTPQLLPGEEENPAEAEEKESPMKGKKLF